VKTSCERCGKRTLWGRHIRYKHGGQWERRAQKTNRPFRPNVQRHFVMVNGERRRMHICTRCLRTMQKTA